jgi:uncharacterized protein (DUF433 family)
MDWRDRIEINPAIMVGKPVLKGTRIAVDFTLELMARDWPEAGIRKSYPQLKLDDIIAALNYSAETMKQESVCCAVLPVGLGSAGPNRR